MPAGSLHAEPQANLPRKQAHDASAETSAEATHTGLISRHEVQMLGLNSTDEKAGSHSTRCLQETGRVTSTATGQTHLVFVEDLLKSVPEIFSHLSDRGDGASTG